MPARAFGVTPAPEALSTALGADARLVRWSAAVLTLAAGLLHLGQVRVHFDEDWMFWAFFIVVGALQVVGGAYLARPLGPRWLVRAVLWIGSVGSLATIGIWFASRAFSLPFGAAPGEIEQIGLADAAAGIFELFTAVFLLIWLRANAGERSARLLAVGAVVTAALIAIWIGTRNAGLFDPDPRAVALPDLVDPSALAFLVVTGLLFAGLLVRWTPGRRPASPSAFVLLTALVLGATALTAFTLPARGGQNRDCAYGPLADDSGLSHIQVPEPIEMDIGERRSAVILILVACAGRPIELVDVRPLAPLGPGSPIRIDGSTLEPARWPRSAWVAPRGSGPQAVGAVLRSNARYPLALEVTGIASGHQALPAMTVEYRDGVQRGSMNFAVIVQFAVGTHHH